VKEDIPESDVAATLLTLTLFPVTDIGVLILTPRQAISTQRVDISFAIFPGGEV
jgi:hypothetical protein